MGTNLIYIKNRGTGEFLRNNDCWVSSTNEAKPFNSAIKAYDFAVENKVPDVEIVFAKHSKVESVLRDMAKGVSTLRFPEPRLAK